MQKVLCRVPFVYGLVDPLEPEHIRYVGIALANPRRPYEHMKECGEKAQRSYKHNWIHSLIADGRMYSVVILLELPAASRIFMPA